MIRFHHLVFGFVTTIELIEKFINPKNLHINMANKIQITKYDKPKAKGLFILFKALELFGVFLFFVGFYGLGVLVNKYFPNLYLFMDGRTDYLYLWGIGFLTFMFIIFALVIAFLIGLLLVLILSGWVKANWNLAKRFSEDKDAKEKRLKEKKKLLLINNLERMKRDREIYGCCKGDEVEIIKKGAHHIGDKGELVRIDSGGEYKINFGNHSHIGGQRDFKVTKKQKLGAK